MESSQLPMVVYDDGVYRVECLKVETRAQENGGIEADVYMRLSNNSLYTMAVSSVLGMQVTAADKACEVLAPADNAHTADRMDGLIEANASREGMISLLLPVEADSFTMKLAVDFLNDQWISFDVSL